MMLFDVVAANDKSKMKDLPEEKWKKAEIVFHSFIRVVQGFIVIFIALMTCGIVLVLITLAIELCR